MRCKRLLVTGGAGFIGSAFIRYALEQPCETLVNLDALTYAANLDNLSSVNQDPRYHFVQGDIRDRVLVAALCQEHQIDAIVHFAAESHVDRSIASADPFVETNVSGTVSLLEVVRKAPHIHFHHVSTDEVYGALGAEGTFSELSSYHPNSPYAASKAASDHFVRAYGHTYGLSYTLSHCTNNYGPGQHKEKLIPQMIERLLQRAPLPLYGDGRQVRDWIFVDDHVEAVWLILQRGRRGETYDIGGECERSNLDLIDTLIRVFSSVHGEEVAACITFVADRPGHDFRYAIDTSKIKQELGWFPRHTLEEGLKVIV
jgi:dTDP-glucose 4,6-dehydratase